MQPLALCGAGGHALVVKELIELLGEFRVALIMVDRQYHASIRTEFSGIPLHTPGDWNALRDQGIRHAALGIGNNAARDRLLAELVSAGFELPPLVHPTAFVSPSAQIGAGTTVLAGAVVGTKAILGKANIVNTSASVDHDCFLEDSVHIAPGAHLAGQVRVGARTWIGLGASVIEGIRIGADTMVGAGAVAVQDLPDEVVAYGVPARAIRANR